MILDHDLDRLADGELSPAERRELLLEIENTPGAWRRCALAFVEAQSIRQELCALRDEARAAGPTAAPRSATPARLGAHGWLAIAASALVAFAAGAVGTQVLAPRQGPPVVIGGAIEDRPALPGPGEVEAAVAHNRQPIESGRSIEQRADQPDPDVVTFWTKDESGERRSLRARLVDASQLDESLGVRFRSAIPPEVRERYESQGFRFESRQRYAPLNMDNGRVVVVPVEDLRVEPAPEDYL